MFPSVPRRRAALAVLAAAAAIPAFAPSAHATISPGSGTTSTPIGQVTLETTPFSYTGPPDSSGKSFSFNSGQVAFTWYQGKVSAHLTGTMHVDGAKNAQARVHIDSLDRYYNEIGTPTYDHKAGTQIDYASQDVKVDMDVPAAPNLALIRIGLEEKSNTNQWDSRGFAYAGFYPRTDSVTLLGRHLDLGGLDWDSGAPLEPATVGWAVKDDGTLTATYKGFVHFTGAAASGRVELREIDSFGRVVDTVDGKTWAFDGNGPESFPDTGVPETIAVTSSTPTLEVVSQSWIPTPDGGYWSDIASQRVSVGDSDN